jgi:hypothetical protein
MLALLGCTPARPSARDSARGFPDASSAHSTATRPALRLLVLTDLAGELEPCGCSARSKGGVDRLVAAISALRAEGIPTLLLVAGHSFYDPTPRDAQALPLQERWEADMLATVLHDLHVDALLPSDHDLQLAGTQWPAWLRQLESPPLLVPNATLAAAADPTASERLVQAAGLRIALLGADLSNAKRAALEASELEQRVTRQRERGADVVISLVNVGVGEAPLTQQSGADLTIEGGALRSEPRVSTTHRRVSSGQRGESLLIVDVYWSQSGQPLALRSSYDPARASELNQWVYRSLPIARDALADAAVREKLRALSKKINQHNATEYAQTEHPEATRKYAGSAPCAACHTGAYLAWKATRHAAAYATLQRLDKEYNLDCVACHLTGYDQGGASLAELEGLTHVGCESCHGASAAHVDDPQSRRGAPRRAVPTSRCTVCHDGAHSPDFDERTYRAKLDVLAHRVPSL